jgi:hypothetical protein
MDKMIDNVGIWLDQRKAIIVLLKGDDERLVEIESNLETFRPHGGYGGANKQLPQDAINDKKYLARKNDQLRAYFKNIVSILPPAEELYILGPGEGRKLFVNFLNDEPKFKEVWLISEACDSIPVAQIIQKVKEHYSNIFH